MNTPLLSHQQIFANSYASDYLANRIILVTGAGDGIGKTAAITLAKHGATVVLTGKTVAKLEATYDEIMQQQSAEPCICGIDLNSVSEDDCQALCVQLESTYGRLDGLLLNASVLGTRRSLSHYYIGDWDQCMNVNVRSQFLMVKALLPLLELNEDGKIVFTTSSVGRKARAHWGAYAVSKFATEGLMQTLAEDLDGISTVCVNAINPGATATTMRAAAYPAENPNNIQQPEDIMPMYLYLLGPLSAGTSGHSLNAKDGP